MNTESDRIARLERTNRRLTLALTLLIGVGTGAALAGMAGVGEPSPYIGIAAHDKGGFLYRMRADGSLERLDLDRGRVMGGGTPADWAPFPTGRQP